jgi:hypothetical protein
MQSLIQPMKIAQVLSEFYISEGRLIDDEMRDLDNSM